MAQIVGQVELQVVPNDQNFNRDLQRIIDKASTGANTNIKPTIDTSGVEAAAAKLTQSATAAADQATQALSGISPDMDTRQFEAAAAQIEAAAEQSAGRASDSFQRIAIGVGVAAAAMYGLKQASDVVVGSLSKLFDNLLKAQAGFEAILGQAEGNKLLADIQEFARVTPFSTEGLVQYSQQLLGVGRSAESIIPTLQSVGDLVASKGGDTQTINRVLFTLTQIQSVGRLIGQDALQLQSALIPITKLLADSMGKTQAEIKALSAAGKISADTVFKTLEEAGLNVAGAMEGATRNIGGAKEGLLDTVTILAQKSPLLISINQDIVDAIKNLTNFLGSDRVATITTELAVSLEQLYKSLQPIFSQLSDVSGEAILTLLEATVPLIQVLGTTLNSIPVPVLTAVGVFLAFNKFQTFISGFGKVVSVLQNFQGVIGNVASGLGRATSALTAEAKVSTAAQAQQLALVRTYQQAATAATTAATASEAYTTALQRQNLEAQKLVQQRFNQPPTGPAVDPNIDPNTGKPYNAAQSKFGKYGGAALGAAGLLALSQRDKVEGAGGAAIGVAGYAATGAALGAQTGTPYGIAIGAAAGAGFGVFQEFQKKAREDALDKAEEWGEVGRKSADAFVIAFNANNNVDTGAATQSDLVRNQAQAAADIILLKKAAEDGLAGPEVQAAADRLGIDLKFTDKKIRVAAYTEEEARAVNEAFANADITKTANAVAPLGYETGNAPKVGDQAGLASASQSIFTFSAPQVDKKAAEAAIEPYNDFLDGVEVARARREDLVKGLLSNDLSEAFFKKVQEDTGAFNNINLQSTAEEINKANDIILGAAYDQLNKFGISEEEALKLGDKIAFYFSDVLSSIQGSVDASFKWNTQLEEAKTALEGINKERLKEANSRLALLNQEEEFKKKIAKIGEDTDPRAAAQTTIDAFKLASDQAAQAGVDQGLTTEEIARKQQELFFSYATDIREQGKLTQEEFDAILRSVGFLDDFNAAGEKNAERIAVINAEVDRLNGLLENGATRGAAGILRRKKAYEEELLALQGVSTEESRAQDARDLRNAQALSLVKANEALVKTYNDIGVAVLLGETSLSQFGDAAFQAFDLANAAGSNQAERNQEFVDSLENIQLVYGYTDQELRKYLDSVGLLDAYNKALIDSNVGVGTTVDDLATKYGLTVEQIRTVLGLVDDVPNDVTIYINAETSAAIAQLKALRDEYASIQADTSLTPEERTRESNRVKAADKAAREAITANGGDVNATIGALEANDKRIKEEEAEKARKEAERLAKEAEAAAKRLQDSITSASNTLENAIKSAADAVEQAAQAWKSDIKERVQYEQAVSVGRLTSNTDRQSRDLTELTQGIDSLRARGVSQQVLDSLGIDNVADLRQVRKLVNANDTDLAKLTEAVSNRDKLANDLAKSEEDKRNRDNITTAIVAAAAILGLDDFDPKRAASISNQINIDSGVDVNSLTAQVLGLLSGGKIG